MDRSILLVGAGIASISAIESLRERGHDGPITLMSRERHLPYDRPPLSKEVMLGHTPQGVLLRPESFYADRDVDLRLGSSVVAVDPHHLSVQTADGEMTRASTIVLATGGASRTLQIPGSLLDGVCLLRTLDDAQDLARRLVPGARVVAVGGGFIGMEVAAAACGRGAHVTVLEAESAPLRNVLPVLGACVRDHHRSRGVQIRGGVAVDSFTGRGRVDGVRLADGEIVPADVVVLGVGMRPSDQIAADAGLTVGNGVHVDDVGRTSHPQVYAIGDVANVADGCGGRHRLEHWKNAVHAGQRAAAAILGQDPGPAPVPWFWSDQFDLNIQVAGSPGRDDLHVVRGDPASGKSTVLFHRDRRLTGVATLNDGRSIRPASDLVAAGVPVEPDLLASPATDLRKLARSVLRAPAVST